jgi:hypothetical protein
LNDYCISKVPGKWTTRIASQIDVGFYVKSNAFGEGKPYLIRGFSWNTIPGPVTKAATLMAYRMLLTTRQRPFFQITT